MMSHKLTEHRSLMQMTTTTSSRLLNVSDTNVMFKRQSTVQRWIFGMIIGSAPFLAILVCWMFVSLIVNNLVRVYQRRNARFRRDTPTNATNSMLSKIDV